MDFAPTTLFVVPVGNTLPVSGSTEDLTSGQFGIFGGKYREVATAANVFNFPYIQIAQGRPGTGLGTKLSDRIAATYVKEFYKVVGHSTAADEIWELSGFAAPKGESLSITVVTHSTFADLTSYNGLVQNVTIDTGCLDCADDPCTDLTNEQIIDLFMKQIALTLSVQDKAGNALRLDSYLTFEKIGTGDSAVIRITSKPVQHLATLCSDLSTRNIDKDRVWFRPFAYKGTATTQDFFDGSKCDLVATSTLIQRSSFKSGIPEEIKQMEVDFYTYQAKFKHLFRTPGFNPDFVSYVDDTKIYDLYFIRFDELAPDSSVYATNFPIDWRVIIAIPNDAVTDIQAILEAFLGTVDDISGAAVTTTTTTSTSSSTTSTTTTKAIP